MYGTARQMGIQVNPGHGKGSGSGKGAYLRLFSDFYISDIILASPLGLRLSVEKGSGGGGGGDDDSEDSDGAEGSDGKHSKRNRKKPKSKEASFDFLSSLEIVVLHQADVMYMQNWEHVQFLLRQTNKLPVEQHSDTDFSRIRPYFLDGEAALRRQLIMTSHFNEPELQACFREHAQSLAGAVRLKKHWGEGRIADVLVPGAKQVFQVVPRVRSFDAQEDRRFAYFKEHVLAPLLRLEQDHTLIVAPSYLSFIRLRNELMHQEVGEGECKLSDEAAGYMVISAKLPKIMSNAISYQTLTLPTISPPPPPPHHTHHIFSLLVAISL